MEEIWKDVKGYETLYQVSNLGRVRSLTRVTCGRYRQTYKGRMLKPILKSIGYYVVSLHRNGLCKQSFIHRLVADAFCEKPNGCDVVDHINTDTKDNRYSNLRWTTTEGNLKNPISLKRRIDSIRKIYCGRTGASHPTSKAVVQLTVDGEFVKRWDCASDAVRECGFDSGSITHCCKGESKYHKGYRWEYAV